MYNEENEENNIVGNPDAIESESNNVNAQGDGTIPGDESNYDVGTEIEDPTLEDEDKQQDTIQADNLDADKELIKDNDNGDEILQKEALFPNDEADYHVVTDDDMQNLDAQNKLQINSEKVYDRPAKGKNSTK